MGFVRIAHPDIEGVASINERALPAHEARGWKRVPPAEPDKPQRNDKTDAWRGYAIHRGLDPAEAAGMSRDGDDGLIAWVDRLDAQPTDPGDTAGDDDKEA